MLLLVEIKVKMSGVR